MNGAVAHFYFYKAGWHLLNEIDAMCIGENRIIYRHGIKRVKALAKTLVYLFANSKV